MRVRNWNEKYCPPSTREAEREEKRERRCVGSSPKLRNVSLPLSSAKDQLTPAAAAAAAAVP